MLDRLFLIMPIVRLPVYLSWQEGLTVWEGEKNSACTDRLCRPPETGPSPVKSVLANFFSEMGVDPGIVDIALSSHQIICLPRQKAQDLHLTTGMGNLYELMGVRLCNQDPLRKNCVVSNVHAMQ